MLKKNSLEMKKDVILFVGGSGAKTSGKLQIISKSWTY